jgi:phosphoribosylformimino-5-aminoimidazole carboxamide ribotide isomerase
MNVYPAIDLMDGKCVRLKQGSFAESTVYSDDPIATAAKFEAQGARYLHVVDLTGAKDPTRRQSDLIGKIIGSTKLKIQTGGGLRTLEQASELFKLGADRVVIGSAAVKNPALVQELIQKFGTERVTLALDVRFNAHGIPTLALQGWQEQSAVTLKEALLPFEKLKISRVLCTDIGRDGMMTGPNVDLYKDLSRQFWGIEFQASGGVGTLAHLLSLKEAGVRSAVVGKALYEGAIDLAEAILKC